MLVLQYPSISLSFAYSVSHFHGQIIRYTRQILAVRREHDSPDDGGMSFEGANGGLVVCTPVVGIDVDGVVVRGECQYLFVHHDERR
jgi:hypothetical protein